MSRIDDALKRVAEDKPDRADAADRPVDRATLDHFPRENRPQRPDVPLSAGVPAGAGAGVAAGVQARRNIADVTPVLHTRKSAADVEAGLHGRGDDSLARFTHEEPAARPAAVPQPGPSVGVVENEPESDIAAKLVVGSAANHLMIEQYRRLAAALHDTQIERGLKTLMVTSALPREGKTLTAVNLALTLSDSYARRVLLVDADLRKPSIHQVLGIANDEGLGEALMSERGMPEFVKVSANCSVLPAGHPGHAPLAGLTSDRMRELLDAFETQFDWIILDTPPVGFLPDGRLLAHLTRAVVFVIGAGSSQFPAVERAVAELGRDCIIGTVLNKVEESVIPDKAYYEEYGPSS